MTEAERRLADDRATRRAAKANMKSGVAQVKRDLAARSVPGRVVDTVKGKTTEALADGIEIAVESKGIIAAVAGGIGLWVFRDRIARMLGMGEKAPVQADDDIGEDEPDAPHDADVSED